MIESCEMLEKCGFFRNFQGNAEVIKKGWIRSFCESKEKSAECKRKKIRQKTGQPPADNITPTGMILQGEKGSVYNY
jgi:hypothetical protein